MNIDYKHGVVAWLKAVIQHYNHDKYWRYREACVTPPYIALNGIKSKHYTS